MRQRAPHCTAQFGMVVGRFGDRRVTLQRRGGELFGFVARGVAANSRLIDDRPSPDQRQAGGVFVGQKLVPCFRRLTRVHIGEPKPGLGLTDMAR